MNAFYSVNPIGELYIPTEFREAVFARGGVRLFSNQELKHFDRIFTHIQRGGVAVVEGEWQQIIAIMKYVEKHKNELSAEIKNKRYEKGRAQEKRYNAKQNRENALSKLMCWADKDGILQVDLTPEIPYLLELLGEEPDANEACPFLVSVIKVQRLQSSLAETYPIHALNASLVASENVLAPRSQETIECFQEAIQSVRDKLTEASPKLADVGCGSGCLTLLAHQEFGKSTDIYTSDILAEAVATTKLNITHHLSETDNIHVMSSGDLFEPFPSIQFDVIIFNAPWVVARVRNRAELAIHDEKQQTLRRFFEQVSDYLKPDGNVLLGYADASGPKAIANLESIIDESGFICKSIIKRRVATHRSKRKWEHIQVSVLGKK